MFFQPEIARIMISQTHAWAPLCLCPRLLCNPPWSDLERFFFYQNSPSLCSQVSIWSSASRRRLLSWIVCQACEHFAYRQDVHVEDQISFWIDKNDIFSKIKLDPYCDVWWVVEAGLWTTTCGAVAMPLEKHMNFPPVTSYLFSNGCPVWKISGIWTSAHWCELALKRVNIWAISSNAIHWAQKFTQRGKETVFIWLL